jgi:peptide methionine sulfoxide reductase msrA/msrB
MNPIKILTMTIFLVIFCTGPRAEVATFAGGCFWCMEPPFEKLAGVNSVVSGYMGGSAENADYKKVSSGQTQHLEVVQVNFDPKIFPYQKLLKVFWRNIDPTQADGQFVDRGPQYKTAIFYHSQAQKAQAEKSKKELAKTVLLTSQ